jgi:diguanylate cyclase (GGDEF)-like protein/PAS domain S-box-containing protein
MRYPRRFKKIVYFLGLALFAMLAGWLSLFIYQGSTALYLEAENAITQLQNKREAVSGMMRSARERSVILLQMSNQSDPFSRDELRFKLDTQAAAFIVFKAFFEKQQLTEAEKSAFNDVLIKVSDNEPLQNQVADLLMADEIDKAQELLLARAMPNQNIVIVEFDKVLKLIEESSREEIVSLQELSQKNNLHTFQLAFLVVGGSLVVFLIIHVLSLRREKELQTLVAERTRELELAHTKTRTLVDYASDGIITIDAEQNIVQFNPAAEKLFGFAAQEVLGQPLTLLLSEKVSNVHQGYVDDFSRDQSVQSRMMDQRPEVQGRRKNGKLFPAEVSISKYVLDSSMFFTAFVRDITKQREAEEEIRHLAMFDSLTGLQNRHHFEARVQESMNYQKRFADQSFWLMFVDLDLFKLVNDTYGHAVGDVLLKEVAGLLQDNVREIDEVGRLGGDEFAILLQGGMQQKDAAAIATKLIKALSAPIEIEANTIQIGASIGITHSEVVETDLVLLFRHADQAMYDAKEAGRNTFKFYE